MKYTKKPKEESKPIIQDSTIGGENYGLQGLANRIAASKRATPLDTPPAPRKMADGGMVTPEMEEAYFMQNQPSTAPPLGQVTTALNQAPPTDYSFYKNISADDRAALQQKLMQQQNSGPSLIAQGAAGLGDAISNSFGGKNTAFQKDVMANNELQQKKQLDAVDTQRTQKMQDYSADMTMQENDPNSPLSQQGRALFQKMGVPVPSGMGFTQLKVLSPQIADLVKGKWEQAFREASLSQQKQNQTAEQGIRQKEQQTREDELNRKGQEDEQKNLEEVAKHWMLHPLNARAAQKKLAQNAGVDQSNDVPMLDIGKTFSSPSGARITRIK